MSTTTAKLVEGIVQEIEHLGAGGVKAFLKKSKDPSIQQADAMIQQPIFVGDPDAPLFAPRYKATDFEGRCQQAIEYLIARVPATNVARDLLTAMATAPAWQAIAVLDAMIRQKELRDEPFPEGWLNLGIAYTAVGDYARAIHALELAVTLFNDPELMAAEKSSNPNAEALLHDAYYQLGLALYISGDNLEAAVSRLREAVKLDPGNAQAHYYLGRALQDLVERETLVEAEQAFLAYLDQGAPLGRLEEVQAFLEKRWSGRTGRQGK